MNYGKGFEQFKEIIEEMAIVYKHDNRPWMIGYSGGKDSTMLCCLVFDMLKTIPKEKRIKDIYIVSSDTLVENPVVKKYMHRMSNMINEAGKDFRIKSDIIYPKIEQSFWCKVIGLGYPTPEPPGFRWCTERLKIHPMNEYTLNKIHANGEVVLLLGVRKAESNYRARGLQAREIDGKLLVPHTDIENAYVYNPLTDIPNEKVWEYLLSDNAITPWGSDNKYLFSLYQGEVMGEEQSVIGEIDKDKIPVTGNSRFGCWICTMVKEDKSLKAFIDRGEEWLIPLRDYRNWLIELRNDRNAREKKRRNGSVYLKADGEIGLGPFTFEARKKILEKLLKLKLKTGLELITIDELRTIDAMWDKEGDISRRALCDLYHDITNEYLPWDEYKSPIFDDDVVEKIKKACEINELPYEMMSKLIISIAENKNYARNSVVSKEFDKILNEDWLHFDNIQKGILNEN